VNVIDSESVAKAATVSAIFVLAISSKASRQPSET
jgi:hypothetical protein